MPAAPRSPGAHKHTHSLTLSQRWWSSRCGGARDTVSSTLSLSRSPWDCRLSKCQPTWQAIRAQNVIHSLSLPRPNCGKTNHLSVCTPTLPHPTLNLPATLHKTYNLKKAKDKGRTLYKLCEGNTFRWSTNPQIYLTFCLVSRWTRYQP